MLDSLSTVNFAMTVFEFTAFLGVITIVISMALFALIVAAVGPKAKKIKNLRKSHVAAMASRKVLRPIPIS